MKPANPTQCGPRSAAVMRIVPSHPPRGVGQALKIRNATSVTSTIKAQSNQRHRLYLLQTGQIQSVRWPSLDEARKARRTAFGYVPSGIRDEWNGIFAPSQATLAAVFMSGKAALASVRHGGEGRTEAAHRTLHHRLQLWEAGRIDEVWQRVRTKRDRTPGSAGCKPGRQGYAFTRCVTVVQHLTETVRKLILETPKGLAAGCSGLQYHNDHNDHNVRRRHLLC